MGDSIKSIQACFPTIHSNTKTSASLNVDLPSCGSVKNVTCTFFFSKNVTQYITDQIVPIFEVREPLTMNIMLPKSIKNSSTIGYRTNMINWVKRSHKTILKGQTILKRRHTLPKPING